MEKRTSCASCFFHERSFADLFYDRSQEVQNQQKKTKFEIWLEPKGQVGIDATIQRSNYSRVFYATFLNKDAQKVDAELAESHKVALPTRKQTWTPERQGLLVDPPSMPVEDAFFN